jgi:phage FluMu protein Com
MEAAHAAFHPAVLENVRCLECGEVYAKPSAGGTVQKNPGCPCCGYVGWIPLSVPLEAPHRFGGSLPPLRPARSH